MLLACTLVGCALFVIIRFVEPIIRHRMAIQYIYSSGGAVLFREDDRPNFGGIYSDPTKDNPWRDVGMVHARSDTEAIAVARQLKYLPETECLYLKGGVSDKGLAAICDSEPTPSFDTIDLLNSPVTAAGLAHLAKLKQLRTLFFNSCPINDACLASVKSLDGLQNLTLLEEGSTANPNRFTEAGFREVGQMKNLRSLWLVQLQISTAAANHLKNLTRLDSLKLSRCLISDDSIAELRKALPQCKVEVYLPEP